ncbi:ESPR-type extended signal peptide-containing protein [Mitsuokella multacida]|uniref:ESPR-type extended signal peptide-containing protein n=1 Tax=Mitsuokella multacida TaxID=52226 RepID=UPI0024200084|nr:ESPR-type extended signal peptide-containing protein [Mitsuokella multacida]
MNRVYKVIYNRARNLYQVVSEIVHSRGKTKSLTAQHRHDRLTTSILIALFAMGTSLPVGWADDTTGTATTATDSTPVEDAKVDASNLSDKNKTAWRTALGGGKVAADDAKLIAGQDIYNELRPVADASEKLKYVSADKTTAANLKALAIQLGTNTNRISDLNNTIGTITSGTYTTDTTVAGNLSNLDTQVKKNADDLSNLSSTVTKNNTDLNTKITSITNDITSLKDLSNITDAGKKVITGLSTKITQGNRVTITSTSDATTGQTTYTISANNDGTITSGDTNLVSGGTMYTELRPISGKYIRADQSTAKNLISLDQNLLNVVNALGLDADDTSKSYTSKLNKYFKVNPNVKTTDTTTTYDPDAAANGTNSVAIGPSAQAGEKTTDATTSATTVTGGTSSTAIGDSAKANGDQSVALGYNSQVLNASGSTTAVSGSTAIGNGAKVEGGSDSTALGTNAAVDTASNAMALGTSATINKTATSGVAIGNGAVTGSADTTKTVDNVTHNVKAAGGEDSIAIGTSASNAGNTSIALGKGTAIENDTDGSYQAVVKSDDIAIGTGAKTSASDSSTAIGKSATVSQSTDAMAIGSSATVGASSNNAMALGKGAAVSSGAADSIAMGTSANTVSADTIAIGQDTSATGANSVVIGKGATTTVEGGNAIGSSSTASGSSTAIGQSATANNYNAVAIGNKATANADKSISLGYEAGVDTSEGKGETQNAGSLIAIGTSSGNNVSGMQNVAIGENAGSNVKSSYNVAIGSQAGYGINYASDDKTQNGFNVSVGYRANYQENSANIMYSTALGNEANASNYSVAVGNRAKAGGAHTVAIGEDAQAADASSIALGQNASAADGNIAIGNGSSAPAVSTLGTVKAVTVDGTTVNYVYDANGNQFKSAFTYKPLQADSHYISVGSSTLTRRISNVADGVFDSDAATVGQLNSLNELLQATDTKVGLNKEYFEEKFTNLNTTIDASKTHYFSISESSDNLSANKDNKGAISNKADAMAIGPNANATNVKSLAVGNNVYANGLRSIAIGTAPNPTTDTTGATTTHNTSADGENSIALGTSTTAQAANSIAIGTRAQTYTTDTSGNTGVSAVAIGNLATTAGNQSVALGYNATVKYDYGTAIGAEALASGDDAVAIGKGSKAYSTDSTAVGQDNSITGNNVYGLGSSNEMNGKRGAITQSGVSGYKNTVTSVSDQDTTNVLTGIYMTGSSNELNQNVKDNVMQDITVQGSSNKIYGGAGGTSSHQNTLSQIAVVGFGNTVQGKSSDDGKTNNIKNVTILGYNNKVNANNDTTVDFSNTQILGNNVTAALGNSVYLGNNAAYVQPSGPAQDAIDAARTKADTAAEASDEYKAAATDEDKATIKAQYEAKYLYKLRVQAMEAKGTTAGMNSYNTDETYGNGTNYTYAGSNPTGVITVGSVGSERRIQNVAAGLVSATSTDAVNGSQLYALTRQIRFGGDNSTFGKTTAADDQNVVARGSNETISITGGSDAVTASTTDGTTTYTVDAAKLTGNNIAVVADKDANALHVQLASNLKDLNTAQLGSGNGESYKETIKLDGTGTSGGQMTLASADGTVKTTLDTTGITIANGPKFTSSGIDAANQQIHNVTAGTKDADAVNVKQLQSARTLLTQGTNTTLADTDADGHHTYTVNVDNLAVKANGTGTTVALANGINFKNGTNTTSSVDANGNVTIDTKNLALKANGTNTATVTMDNGINFKNGTNTTATVGTDGTVTINATHNKLSTVSAATGDKDNVTLTLTDADGNTVTSTSLKNTYTTVTKDGTAHTVTFARNDGTTQTLSLGDLDGASKGELATAAAKATSEVTNGTNVASVTKRAGTNGQNIYTVNVDDLAVKTTSGEKKSVHLADGLVFADGTNTTATVGDNGTIKFNVSDAAIKKQAVQAVNVTGDNKNVTVTPETNADGTLKTFTVTATHNKLNATGAATKATADSNAVTLTLQDADGNTTTTGLTDTYTTVSKDGTNKKVTFKRNDGETQTLELSDLGGITAAQDKYITGGTVSYDTNGNGTASLTGTNGLTASIRGLKDTKVSSGTASYMDAQGNATMNGSAVLTMNDGSTATISGLKDDYITSAAVGAENNHVTMTRLGGGTVDLNLNPILEKYSLSDYHLVGAGTTHDQAYAVDSNGTVTLNIVDDKNPTGTPKTIQITGLASQTGVNAGRTTVTSSDSSVKVLDSTANSDTHTYDIKVDYSKIPANMKVQYSGDNGTSGSNTMNTATAFSGTANQIVTTATDGKVSFKLADGISGIKSVTTGDSKLNTDGLTVTNGPTFTKSNIDVNNQQIHKVTAGESDTDAANVGQVKAATTEVQAGTNVSVGKPATDSTDNHKIYTVNVDNLALSQNDAKVGTGVALKNGLNFKDGTNTTASVTADGKVSFSISNDAIKAQAKDAVVLTGGDNVTIGTPTDENNVKTYTVSVSDLKLQADGADKATRNLSEGINFAGGTNTTADVTADGKVTYDLKDSISLNQVQTGESKLNTNGLTITDGPKVLKSGIDAGNKQITNVASGGTVESNAATIGDLKKAIETASAGTTASGFKTKGNYGEAVTSRLDKQLNVVGDVDTTKVAKDNLSNDNVGVVTSTDTNGNATLTVKLNKDINLGESGSVTTGSTIMNNTGITIQNGPKFTNNGIDAANQKITGVDDGIEDKDAVNVSQLKKLQKQVSNSKWTLAGKDVSGTAVDEAISDGKKVTFGDGQYTKSVVGKDKDGNATVKVDVTTGTLTAGADGKISSTDGLVTTGAVENAVNNASWTIQDGNNTGNAQQVKAGDTVSLKAGDNLSLDQDGKEFTYKLNKTLENMTSVTVVDDKKNTSVLNGEGLKVSDKDGNSLTQHATEIRIHDSNAKADDVTTDVVLKKDGLHNGGHTITGVADGQLNVDSKEAVNGSQLYALQQKVTNGGWDIIGENENRSTHIGNDKTVSFKNGRNSTVSVTGTDTGAEVKVDVNTAQISTDGSTHTATVTGTGLADATEVVNAINSAAWNVQKQGGTVQQVKAGDTVTFDASNNIVLTQNGTSFTYSLAPDVNTKSIRLGGSQDTSGSWTGGIFIGNQIGGGANHNEGNYITGLDNTSWDLSKVVDNRAATEAQLKAAINQITLKEQNGGFALKDESGTEKGKVSQTLGNAIAIVGDTEYESDGKTVKKAGNITTEADGTNVGGIKVKLNKNLDLSDEGSLRVGSSKVSNGAIQLGEDASANKILMDSTNGTASIGGVTVNGAEKTVNGLSNTKWTGKAVDGQAATENQLVEAINEAKTQAANSELHIKKGVYAIGKDSNGQDITDKTSKNSVSIDVVNAKGAVDGQVVINDVAKASELGTVGELADNLKNPNGGPTTVVQAVNKVNQKVDDSLKQVNGDVTNAVTEAKKHTKVQSVDSDNNVTIDGTTTNTDGGTVYKLGLNKQHMNLDKVHIYGTEGKVTAKDVEAETVKTGNTTVADGRVVVGGDNGIKIEANDGQQTISGLSNRTWNGRAVSGRAATEDQLQQAVENATATAAQNEQHIQAGNYNVGQGKGLDGKAIDKNSVAINVVSGDGTKPGDVKGQVVINNVAKADELGDVAKLNDTVKNADGRPTSTVDAINNLDKRVETTVGDNVYSGVKGKEIADGDSATTAIGKLNNRMNDIYTTAGQHSSVSTADTNLTLSESKNASGGTDYKIGLNKDQINLGNLTIKGNEGSIEAKSIKSDSFTAGDTVVNKDGIKVGDKSALTGDSLKVNGKTYVDDKGVNANGQVIRNVGDGKDDGDAVNVKQVNDLAARQGEVIGQNAAHINQLDRAVNRLDSRINRVGAGAAALAALHPGNYDPDDKVDFAAGFGNYRGASAAAVGMYYHPDETTTMSVGASFGGGENMVNAGITWKMGKDSGHMRTQAATKAVPVQFVAAPTQTTQPTGQTEGTKTPQPVTAVTTTASGQQVPIVAAYLPSVDNSTRAENDELKELLARQTAILEKLAEQKTAAAPAAAAAPVSGEDLFPDVPENHWAYDFVAKLAKAGALKDCRVEDPANNPMLTRNDFAQILYTALKNGATKNPALNKDNGLNRLASEFRAELKNVKR